MPDEIIHTLSYGFDWCADRLDWPLTTEVGTGLAGVIADGTRVMWLDPSSGRLAYRGVEIDALAARPDFEATAHLLITGSRRSDGANGLGSFRADLRASRSIPADVVQLVKDLSPTTHPTRALRAGVSALGCHELSVDDDLDGDRHWRELRIVGQVVSLVSCVVAARRGSPESAHGPSTSLAEGVVRALTGNDPAPDEVEALDLLWVLYAAHGLDAPTFTSMIVASCLADPYYNVVAGLSALRGHRQGGVGEQVIGELLSLEGPSAAQVWVDGKLARKEPIPGFGHRVYRMPDPRVVPLRKASASLAHRLGQSRLYETTRAVEDAATAALAAKGVFVNINLYGALVFHLLGAHPSEIPCLIAAARVAGMVALVRETLDNIRLYRPMSRYVGPAERSIEGRSE
jgi:citrate synthase